jgi:hypothetical protein
MIAAAILALFLIFGFGGGGFGELMTKYAEDPVKDTLVDEDRREQALDELKSLEKSVKELNKGVSRDMKAFHKLVEDYDSKPADFDTMFASAIARREQEVNAVWERRSAMLTHIRADEWQTIIASASADMEEDKKK